MAASRPRSTAYVYLLTLVAALGGLLFGYDTAVISGGIEFLTSHFNLNEVEKGWAAGSALLGCALGAALAGALSDRLGRRRVLILSGWAFLASAIGTALPWDLHSFVFFRVLGGIGIGAASLTSPLYIAEVSPADRRGRLVSINQLAIVTGMVVVYFVNYAIAHYGAGVDPTWNEVYGWRWMFGSEALPAGLFLALLCVVPESPRWLVRQRREQEAVLILTRIGGAAEAERELASIRSALAEESDSIAQLFRPGLRHAAVIGVVLAIFQQITGINVFLYFAPAIFSKMGSQMDAALLQTIYVGTVNLFFTVVAIQTVDRIGRRPLMVVGYAGMAGCLLAMGVSAYTEQTAIWVLFFILGYIACFALSVGPVTWVILSEIFPTSIRGRAMAIATVCLWLANFVVTQTFTIMDENAYLVKEYHHAVPFWIYAAMSVVALVFILIAVPETKGKSLEEIERQWMRRR
ncbi:MAG: sugar porter family MFS transporter [Planctomycetota bacterium]